MGKKAKNNIAALVFCVLVFGFAVSPLIGMAWASTQTTTENRALAPLPLPVEGRGTVNLEYLSQMGTYFEDHYAWRNELVAVNAHIRAGVFGVSASDQVVLGSDGWLYYAGTISDYVGAAPLTERELRCIAHNLSFMQGYAEAQGAQFAFTIAPNKNTLYPEHMPSFYLPSTEISNAERLTPYLKEYQVSYVDLFSALGNAGSAQSAAGSAQSAAGSLDPLYLLRDSHWNNRGALIASNALSKEVGLATLGPSPWIDRDDWEGDLSLMLFPRLQTAERQSYLEGINDGPDFAGSKWSYQQDSVTIPMFGATTSGIDANIIRTRGSGTGALILYCDSFGNALLPYLATQTSSARFSRGVPYNALSIVDDEANYVLVERAERHLDYLSYSPPSMPCPTVPLDTASAKTNTAAQARSTCAPLINGPLIGFGGEVDSRLIEDDSRIYVSAQQLSGDDLTDSVRGSKSAATAAGERVFEAFLLSPGRKAQADAAAQADKGDDKVEAQKEVSDVANGYLAYIPRDSLTRGDWAIKVFVTQGDTLFLVQSMTYRVE